jgi:hypothetical protein
LPPLPSTLLPPEPSSDGARARASGGGSRSHHIEKGKRWKRRRRRRRRRRNCAKGGSGFLESHLKTHASIDKYFSQKCDGLKNCMA